MENPCDDAWSGALGKNVNDVSAQWNRIEKSARFKTPVQRKTPGFSAYHDDNDNDDEEPARFKIPAKRGTPGPSDPARFQLQAQNSAQRNRIENETTHQNVKPCI